MQSLPPIIVSGFGRCGSTMVMTMLQAGGVPWTADASELSGETPGLDAALAAVTPGHAVKVLLGRAADARAIRGEDRRVVWCSRDPREQAKSMEKFMHRMRLIPPDIPVAAALKQSLPAETVQARRILRRAGTPVLVLDYATALRNPVGAALRIAAFLPQYQVDASAAAEVVQARSARCS